MYTVMENYVDVIGGIWWPYGLTCALRYRLTRFDVEQLRGDDGTIGRAEVSGWVETHAGDFSSITDFRCCLDAAGVEMDWQFEESACTYSDCMFPAEAE